MIQMNEKIRILVLEDEMSMNRGISFSLNRNGYESVQAYSLKEAEILFNEKPCQICICDITLPDGNGLDFVMALRNKELDFHPYVIVLTALDTETDHVIGYESGADDYIAKPFSLSVLMLKIEAYVKRNLTVQSKEKKEEKPKEKRVLLTSGNIRLDVERMEVFVGEASVCLTRNELKLLNVFLRHPKQVLSKTQLLEQAFDVYENYVDENTLAVNISRLRDKLGDRPQKPVYIKNVRGLGYLWMKDVQK